ncbi:MAG: carbamoyltransferase C-terminal domain-containing protein [Candidatus Sulfotelmatobacter sp.]
MLESNSNEHLLGWGHSLVRQILQRRPRGMDVVVGLACTGHGASMAIMTSDGAVRSSVLDRWAGVKHLLMFARREERTIRNPSRRIDKSIKYNLCYGYSKFPPTEIFEDTIVAWFDWLARGLNVHRSDVNLVVTSPSHFTTCRLRLGYLLHRWFPNAYVSNVIEHHQVHQRQAFWQSGLEEAAVLTLDASGEPLKRLDGRTLAGTIACMDTSGGYRELSRIFFPDSSPGLLYQIASKHLGFPLGDEGKTMGLAPYGEPELLRRLLPILQLHDDGSFTFMRHSEFQALLEEYVSPCEPGTEINERHKNVAYAAQALIEQIVGNAFRAALRMTGRRKLVYGGGVALNCVANDVAFRAAQPESLYVPPNPGDTGHALGCALFGAYEMARWCPSRVELSDYMGPAYSEKEMVTAARESGYPVHETGDQENELAKCIANGYITARFAGSAEFGPRALGNRSILCDPRRADMKDYLNSRVKHRESFRPYAPSVLQESAAEWFELEQPSAYMLRAVPARPRVSDRIPAVVHVDGSCRVQTVSQADNPGFHRVIQAFESLTGFPLVLNTSFNVGGKPIVETPADAVACFRSTNIDVLALGPVIVSKCDLNDYRTPRLST